MERFVQFITAGGVALVAGLWATALVPPVSVPWLVGAFLVLAGAAALAVGIWTELDVEVGSA